MLKYTLFRRFLFFNIVVLLIPIWLGSIFQIKAINVISEKNRQINESALSRSILNLDERFKEVNRLSQQILTNNRVRKYASETNAADNENIYLASQVLSDLAGYRGLSTFVEDIFVFFPSNDTVVTTTGKYHLDLFLQINGAPRFNKDSVETWKQNCLEFSGIRKGLQIMGPHLLWHKLDDSFYYFSIGHSYSHGSEPDAVTIITARKETVSAMLRNIAGAGECAIKGRLDQPIAETEGYAKLRLQNSEDIRMEPSGLFGWKYEIIIPSDLKKAAVENIIAITIYITAISLIIGLITAWILARISYLPIKRATEFISESVGSGEMITGNELDFIRSRFRETLNEDRKLKERLLNQRGEMRQMFFLRLLNGRAGDIKAVERNFDFLGINFVSDCFLVSLIRYESQSGTPEDTMSHLITGKLIEDQADRNDRVFIAELPDGIIAVIFNLSEEADHPEQSIKLKMTTLADYMNRTYHITSFISMGSREHEYEGINLSYQKARETLQYQHIRGEHPIMQYKDMQKGDRDYYYPSDLEKSLINAVNAGDKKEIETILDEIYDENLVRRNLTMKVLQILLYELTGTALRVLKKSNSDISAVFGSGYDPMDELIDCVNIGEVFKMIRNIFYSLCHYIDESKQSHNEELKDKITLFLEENFTDHNFSQSVMADSLGITPSYLSYFYREQFGENMVQKVNLMRIDKAKRIISEDRDMLLSQVARSAGCFNDKSLIRLFRKYENTTPGKFRESLHTER